MALQAVLSVLSEAIKRDASAEEVAALIDGTADLSPAEREDLKRIPFEHLEPYQSDIYSAERGMLEWGFTNTWHCLRQLDFGFEPEEPGDPERGFVVRFKTLRPCPTHSVREMGALFEDYLKHDCMALSARYPWLPELAGAERLEIEVLYAEDNPIGRPLDEAGRMAFFSQSLDAVLSARLVRAEKVEIKPCVYDFTEIKDAVQAAVDEGAAINFNGRAFQTLGETGYFGIARDHARLTPVWYYASETDARCLEAVTEDTPVSLEALAGNVLHHLVEAGDPEEVQLAKFLHWVDRGLRMRYLLVA